MECEAGKKIVVLRRLCVAQATAHNPCLDGRQIRGSGSDTLSERLADRRPNPEDECGKAEQEEHVTKF